MTEIFALTAKLFVSVSIHYDAKIVPVKCSKVNAIQLLSSGTFVGLKTIAQDKLRNT